VQNNYAVAAWQDAIALRSPAGVWQAPVHLGLTGSVFNFQVKLDAQGNGVAVWGRLTDTNTVVEAVTWTANGTFEVLYSFHHYRTEHSVHNWLSTMLEQPWSSGWHRLRETMPTRIRLSRRPGPPGKLGRSHNGLAGRAADLGVGSGARWVRQRDGHMDHGHYTHQRASLCRDPIREWRMGQPDTNRAVRLAYP